MKSRLLSAACTCVLVVATSTSHADAISGQGTWETTLLPRDLDGNTSTIEAYYDTVLNITWLANDNLAQTNKFGVSGINVNGAMTWDKAIEWIAAMNASGGTGYFGYNNWRLPKRIPSMVHTIYTYPPMIIITTGGVMVA